MPTAMEFMESDKVSRGERSSFTGTCSLLRKYLRENGSVGDLTLGLSLYGAEASKGNLEIAEFHLPAVKLEQKASEKTDGNPLALFPQHAGFSKTITENVSLELPRMGARSQMTIFYGGRMVAFDDIPVEKVEAIMQFIVSTTATKHPPPTSPTNTGGNGGDLSLKRKASFQRFLESRKDRLSARAPYRVNQSSSISAKEESQSEKKVGEPSEPTIPISFGL